ncbi:hypothetical protein HK098_001853 [Nowakowskiella sp. JEL0407]|nr:hypothetical protein HK098_001853 [Nowakowskiella sp. JEL0407]
MFDFEGNRNSIIPPSDSHGISALSSPLLSPPPAPSNFSPRNLKITIPPSALTQHSQNEQLSSAKTIPTVIITVPQDQDITEFKEDDYHRFDSIDLGESQAGPHENSIFLSNPTPSNKSNLLIRTQRGESDTENEYCFNSSAINSQELDSSAVSQQGRKYSTSSSFLLPSPSSPVSLSHGSPLKRHEEVHHLPHKTRTDFLAAKQRGHLSSALGVEVDTKESEIKVIISPAEPDDTITNLSLPLPKTSSIKESYYKFAKGFLSPFSAVGSSERIGPQSPKIVKESENIRRKKRRRTHVVIPADLPYIPQFPDEIYVNSGDLMEIETVYNDGWIAGKNHKTGKEGVYPSSCLPPPYNNAHEYLCPIHFKPSAAFLAMNISNHNPPLTSDTNKSSPLDSSLSTSRLSSSSRFSSRSSSLSPNQRSMSFESSRSLSPSLKPHFENYSEPKLPKEDTLQSVHVIESGDTLVPNIVVTESVCTCPDSHEDEYEYDEKSERGTTWSWQPSEGTFAKMKLAGEKQIREANIRRKIRQSRNPFGIYKEKNEETSVLSLRSKIIIFLVTVTVVAILIALGVRFGIANEEKVVVDDSQYSPIATNKLQNEVNAHPALLENVEMKFALSDTDEKFEKAVSIFLAPVLLKLNSPHQQVRTKVTEICAHVNKRLKSSPSIKIPTKAILDQFGNASSSNLLRNVALIYLEMGASRMDDKEKIGLLPGLIAGFSSRLQSQQITLFQITLPILANINEKDVFSSQQNTEDPIALEKNLKDAKFLFEKILKVMLYTTPPAQKAATPLSALSPMPEKRHVLSGLSKSDVQFITNSNKAIWTKNIQELKSLKLGLLKFCSNPKLVSESTFKLERFLIYLAASADANHEIISSGEDGLRRGHKPDFEDIKVVAKLYALYQGSTHQGDKVTEENFVNPANISLKVRIVPFLLKSVKAANYFPAMLQVSFDCINGDDATNKLRNLGMSLFQWIARMTETAKLTPISPVLLTGLIQFIEKEADEKGQDADTLKGFAYEAVGLLSKRVPLLFTADVRILYKFFDAVNTEERNVRVSVQNALSNMIPAYQEITNSEESSVIEEEIKTLLLINAEKPSHQARYAAVKYANALFPFSNIDSRFVCLLGTFDQKLEVKEESRRGLRFPWFQPTQNRTQYIESLPDFNKASKYFHQKSRRSIIHLVAGGETSSRSAGIRYVGGLTADVYSTMLSFLRRLLVLTADPGARALIDGTDDVSVSAIGSSVNIALEEFVPITDVDTRTKVRNLLAELWKGDSKPKGADDMQVDDDSGIKCYVDLIDFALKSDGADALLQMMACSCLLELISLAPTGLAESYGDKIEWIESFLSSIKVEARQSMAHVLGMVSTSSLRSNKSRCDELSTLLQKQCTNLTSAETKKHQYALELADGSTMAIGYILGRLTYRYPTDFDTLLSKNILEKSILCVLDGLNSSSSIVMLGACHSLAEIGRYSDLLTRVIGAEDSTDPDAELNDQVKRVKVNDDQTSPRTPGAELWTFSTILRKLKSLSENPKDVRVQEAAITTFAHIAMGNWKKVSTAPSEAEKVLDYFFTLPDKLNKQVEVHFTVGEAICAIAGQWEPLCVCEYLDIADATIPNLRDDVDASVTKVLEKCFEFIASGKPSGRKGICVWLLCIVKYLGNNKSVKRQLEKVHGAFSSLLVDRDDFIQEVASKGIGIVYELGDPAMKKELVQSLVSTFTEGKKLAPQSVTAETTLFDNNALGNTPEGTNITTYQSILSLAADLNQPDLVYRFMNLASHHAVWNSRKGASFGLHSIVALSRDEIRPFLPQLIPRLYRFQYDPNPKVAESMKNIWRALITEDTPSTTTSSETSSTSDGSSGATSRASGARRIIDDYFDMIMKDLLVALGDRQWRSREASCHALNDLLVGRSLQQLEPYLENLWASLFRVLDDIKESVRVAAFSACKTLTNITVRYCDPTVVSEKEGQKIIDIIFPFFMTKGLGSSAEDVRKFSLKTILRITKSAKSLLKPHLTELMATLLESLSVLEPQAMNYLSFHTEKYNISQDQLDSSRLNAAKMSPMMDALESSIEQIDAKVLETLVPRLIGVVRKGVGLPTKAGSARFIVSLCVRIPQDLRPHADNILKALSGAISDRSAVVRKAFASACGYTAHLATEPALKRFVTHLRKLALESEDEDTRSIPAITLLETSKRARTELEPFLSTLIPLAFLGARDLSPSIKEIWTAVFSELIVGSVSSSLNIYGKEIIDMFKQLLSESPSWNLKRQVGLSISDMADTLGDDFKKNMTDAVAMLMEALGGRTWEGKQDVVKALSTVCVVGKDWFAAEGKDKLTSVCDILIREAKKNNREYKPHSIEAMGKAFDALKVDCFDKVWEYLLEMLLDEGEEDDGDHKMEGDGAASRNNRENSPVNILRQKVATTIGQVWSENYETQVKYSEEFIIELGKAYNGQTWGVRVAILGCFEKFVEKLKFDSKTITVKSLSNITDLMVTALNDKKYTAIRENGSKILKQVIQKAKGSGLINSEISNVMAQTLSDLIETEPLGSIKDQLKEIKNELKA